MLKHLFNLSEYTAKILMNQYIVLVFKWWQQIDQNKWFVWMSK